MKKFFMMAILSSTLLNSAFAENGYWEKAFSAYNIYVSGGTSTKIYSPPSNVPRNGTSITGVIWSWEPYDNDYDTQLVELCYRQQYQTWDTLCLDVSDTQVYFTNAFNGFSAQGSFVIRFTLEGGTYPAVGAFKSDDPDIVGVYYTY